MIQETFDRISKLVKTENIFVVSNENHSSHIHKQLNLPKGNVILRDAHNCGVFSNGIPVAIAHLDDIIVVVDENGVLVTKRGTTQDVKNIKL